MAQQKRGGSGRVTPKGTKAPEPTTKRERPGLPQQPQRAPHEASRPITHNRGNR